MSNTDTIVYTVVSNGGGMDGMDSTDKGGKVLFASLDRTAAERKVTPWSTLKPIVVNAEEAQKVANAKLDPIDEIFVGWVDQVFR